jgi:integrase
MATIKKRGAVWQVQVNRRGVRKSASFRTKSEASSWAAKIEAEAFSGAMGVIPNKPVSELLERYRNEVSIKKRGERWERIRIASFLRDPLASVRLPRLSSSDIAAWRDRRLMKVSSASVARDWGLLRHAFSIAVREWGWLKENPFFSLCAPKSSPARDRRISQGEIDAILSALGYDANKFSETQSARVGAAFLFAMETAMRVGEICGLRWGDINGAVARLSNTKNGYPRDVPLSPAAISIIDKLPKVDDFVFGITTWQINYRFQAAKAKAEIKNLHFHDTRHEAVTRLAKKLDVLDLARMVGHRNLKMLMVYYNPSASEIALRLADSASWASPSAHAAPPVARNV